MITNRLAIVISAAASRRRPARPIRRGEVE
jgi:hypothetical protein